MPFIRPSGIKNKVLLSQLLDAYLCTLQQSPLQVQLRALCYDTGIPEKVLHRLAYLHLHPEDTPYIKAEDYHLVFASLQFRFPTVRIYRDKNGQIYFIL